MNPDFEFVIRAVRDLADSHSKVFRMGYNPGSFLHDLGTTPEIFQELDEKFPRGRGGCYNVPIGEPYIVEFLEAFFRISEVWHDER